MPPDWPASAAARATVALRAVVAVDAPRAGAIVVVSPPRAMAARDALVVGDVIVARGVALRAVAVGVAAARPVVAFVRVVVAALRPVATPRSETDLTGVVATRAWVNVVAPPRVVAFPSRTAPWAKPMPPAKIRAKVRILFISCVNLSKNLKIRASEIWCQNFDFFPGAWRKCFC